jgi:hypothetical protein
VVLRLLVALSGLEGAVLLEGLGDRGISVDGLAVLALL